ncbi:hypothetical protein DFJ58DRAFT_412501 [Suillus subalutaceus]|uniref:uncharacterized protein n=1 Tax=Suillus subalutaceus TaxID=48586 RepID=UPI001B862813|nr:uncharacterized protein DFJ58DRAFT_412501 [Suillus subalutaceus]KAG1852468.1 hypothetical protein DFJ58DRAFT_412501 [Suillus subalutaceus]
MSSQAPQTNLSMERFRLDGMMVACAFYGVFFLLTVQAWIVLMQHPRYGGQIADHRHALLFYVFITFVLGTISFGMNAKYTEMIWIDLRDAPGGPLALIEGFMSYRINFIALTTGHIQGWFMQALPLYRCFVIWNWSRWVMVPMITLYVAMIGLSITVLYQAGTNGSFYNNPIELAYLCIEAGQTVIYTILVTNRLFVMRGRMKQIMAQYDSSTYDAIALMVIECAALYSVFAIIFIVSFGMHSDGVVTLCFLSIGKIQGIAQLFIIIRVARGRVVTHEWSTQDTAIITAIAFTGTVSGITEGTDNERIGRPERDVIQLYGDSDSERAAEVSVSVA